MAGKVEEILLTKRIYEGNNVNLRVDTISLPGGRTAIREVVEHSGAVAIVPVNEKGEILLVRQYRHAVGKSLLEIPAGKLEPGESMTDCAGRELLEETGYEAASLHRLISFFSTPGFTNEMLHLFLATGLTYVGQKPDDDEDIDLVIMPFERAIELVWEGEICDAKSIAGILAVARSIKKADGN
ncbi:NUDIX hydrolase [Pelotomaculum isophthalicicum JI]|uniref:NUDIX hydrolase n=1 Tax=Pelotomaculum isophthalicicum JI TaxID=947010 RepID=A0A9X4JTE2_9FIRM|nr:NUDIX hydrolase [Pelotomaculum isophthalicicum]MDF9407315.1 NUDIX hydrolase [Pelotomaculum isophthalicicum JI]